MTGYNTTQNRRIVSRAIISALALVALAFSGMAAAEQLYVTESGWWRDGGAFNTSSTPIQTAVDNATAGGSVFVWNGSYSENVDVNKTLTLEGEGADVVTVTAADSGDHVFDVTADYVNISGFAVRGATDYGMAGIYLDNANYCNISGNNVYGNSYGIRLSSSSNNTLTNNTANSNNGYGIYLSYSSDNNTLTNNTANSNNDGIYLFDSSDNTLTNNTANENDFYGIHLSSSSNNMLTGNIMAGNTYNFDVYGNDLSHYVQSIDTSNIVCGKPVYYWVDQQNKQLSTDAGYIGVVNSTNITMRNLTLIENNVKILFAYTNNSRIENVTASIYLYSSSNNNLTGNNASNNYNGISLSYSSNNTLTDNTANSNNYNGISLSYSSNNTLHNNTASNNKYGIYFEYSSNNTLHNNIASNNEYGIRLSYSSNNMLTGDIMAGNAQNFGVHGNDLSHYVQSIDTSNMVGGKPICYWVDQQNKRLSTNAGYIGVVNSTNITVKDLTLGGNKQAVLFAYTKSSRIENVTASIYLSYSDNNTLQSNTHRIHLRYSSNNKLTNNSVLNNWCGTGIYLYYSDNNTLTNNIANSIVSRGYYHIRIRSCGIFLEDSSNNTLTNNTVSNNAGGIRLSYSSNNLLTNNTASNNDYGINNGYGIRLSYSSNNLLTNNIANLNGRGIYLLYSSSNNNITCNWVQNNKRGFYLSGGSTGNTIEHNNIIENGNYNTTSGGWEWQFYVDQYNPVEAKHNYWGAGMNNTTIDASIYDDEEGWGEVAFYPFETEPVQCPLTPEEPPAFTTADAMIALQIAVGSRPPDLRWDVSGDGSVTSLDALMILQAAADSIEIG